MGKKKFLDRLSRELLGKAYQQYLTKRAVNKYDRRG